MVADGRSAGGAVIHVDRETGAQVDPRQRRQRSASPAGLAVVGGAGVDQSGGGNGDPDGPAAPPPPPIPATRAARRRRAAPAARAHRRRLRRRPGGRAASPSRSPTARQLVTLPPGVTAATSGIRGVDFVAPSFMRKPQAERHALPRRPPRPRRSSRPSASARAIQWLLNEPARVTVCVQKSRHLSRVCRRKARSSRHRTGTRCRKWVTVKGRASKASLAGVSSVRFRGRLKGKTLKPGRYRFVIRARDGAGNVSKPQRPAFRIVR